MAQLFGTVQIAFILSTLGVLLSGAVQASAQSESLGVAVREGEIEEVRRLLAAGADPDLGLDEWTPLMLAAMNGELEIAEMLLEAGASLSPAHGDYGTALGVAAVAIIAPKEGESAMVDLLLDAGAATESGNGVMMTPLMFAAREGKRSVVERLLKGGANAGHQDVRGWSPLLFAVRSGDPEIVEMILDAGAWPDVPTELPSRRPIHYLSGDDQSSRSRVEIARLLIEEGADPDGVEYNQNVATPLLRAAAEQEWELVEYLLEEGAWPNFAGFIYAPGIAEEVQESEMTALDWAEHYGDERSREAAEELRDAGGLRYEEIAELYRGIREAIASKDLEAIEEIFEEDIRPQVHLIVDIEEEDQFSPHNLAFDSGDREILEEMLSYGKPGFFTLSFWLEEAMQNGREDLLALLIEEYPVDALVILFDHDRADLTELALSEAEEEEDFCGVEPGGYQSGYGTPAQQAAMSGNLEILARLMDGGCEIDQRDIEGTTPLMAAAGSGQIEVATWLLEHGADPNARTVAGNRPMLEAVRDDNVAMLALLLEHGADIEGSNGYGSGPLHLAAWMGKGSVVDWLLEKGADPNARDHFGETPLVSAQRRKNVAIEGVIRGAGGTE